MAGPFDLTGQNIENTYQRVLQTPDGVNVYDGTGSAFVFTAVAVPEGPNTSVQFNGNGLFSGSSNFTFNSASNTLTLTGSLNITGSTTQTGNNTLIGNTVLSGSIRISGSSDIQGTTTMTGSLNITGSTTQIGNNSLLGNTRLSGSIIISGAFGTNNPTVRIYGDTLHDGYIRFDPVSTNIDTSISASYIYVSGSTNDLYFNQNGSGYNNVTRLRWLEGNLYTGLLHGGNITAPVGGTTFNVSSGSGIVVDLNASLTDDPYPTIKFVNWDNILNQSINELTNAVQTFIGIDSNGQIIQQTDPWFNGQYNESISIGTVLHQNKSTVNASITYPNVAYGYKQRTYDFIKAFGPLKLSGFTLLTSSSLGLTVAAGTAFADGRNYQTDPNNPSYITDPGTTVSKIFRYYQSGSAFVQDTNNALGFTGIDVTKYNLNGSGSLVNTSGGKYYAYRVFWYPNSATKGIVVYYGLGEYNSLDIAQRDYQQEPFVETPNTQQNAIQLATIFIRGNGSFTTPSDYRIVQSGLFRSVVGGSGGGGGGASDLSALTDVQLGTLTDKQSLVYDFASSKWKNSYSLSGSLTGSLYGTASWATNFISASDYVLNSKTGSFAITGSNIFRGDQTISGGLFVYNTVTNNNSLDTLNRALISSDGITGVSWGDRRLIGNNGFETVKWNEYILTDSSRNTSVDWENRQTLDSNEVASINWNTKQLLQSDGVTPALNYYTDNIIKIIGDLIPGDPITNNTSSWSLGSPTAAWKDLYVSNGSITFISGSSQASIKLDNNNNIIFTGASVTLPTSSIVTTAQTASYLNTLNQNLTLSGSLTILNNLTIFGTQSVVYITSSQLDISTNIITVNTSTPAVRFGGIAVKDSGSLATGRTGSLLWDSQNDVWIYSNPSGAAYDGGLLLTGPRNTSGLGNEVGITTNYLSKGDGSHHMTSSQISDDGTTVTIPGKLSVTSGITGSLFGTSSWATNATNATNTSQVFIIDGLSGNDYYIPMFVQSTEGSNTSLYANGPAYSTNTSTLTATNFNGTATTALTALTASSLSSTFAPSFIAYTGGTVNNGSTTLADVHSSAGWNNISAGFYEFEIYTTYNSAATTVGIKLSISGTTAFSYLAADIGYSTGVADRAAFMFATFDGGGTAASSFATTNNASIMQGHINVTSTGQLRLRYASEVGGQIVSVTNVTGYLRRLY